MELDNHLTFGEIHGSWEALINQLLEIQTHAVPQADYLEWLRHLRFICVPNLGIDELDEYFKCPRTLRLSGRDENPGENNYVAVSYCWASFDNPTAKPDEPRYTIQ